jgi:transposase-like protein
MSNHSKKLGKVVSIDYAKINAHLGELVRCTVEETLNAMLEAEADVLCGAQRYERNPDRVDTRAGGYERQFHTKAGEVTLKMPKLRKQTFETAIIGRYRRREASIEESPIEMYLAGFSVRRVEDITETLWGTRVSSGTVSKLNHKVYKHIEAWGDRPIDSTHPYVYLDGIVLKRSWAGEIKYVSVFVTVGVNKEGYRRILGVAEGHKEDNAGWSGFLTHLKERGLKGVKLAISDACLGLVESVAEYYPGAHWQRCTVHFYRNVFSYVPNTKVKQVANRLKAIHAQESLEVAQQKARAVIEQLREMKLTRAADWVDRSIAETLTYYRYRDTHWQRIRTNNPLERIMREIRRRTRVVGAFPDGQSALMLCAARLRHIAGTKWGTRRYLSMVALHKLNLEKQLTA